MWDIPKHNKRTDIESRAAQIRRRWSPSEKILRMGLPPDMPAPLRAHLQEFPVNAWPPEGRFKLVESRLIPVQNSFS